MEIRYRLTQKRAHNRKTRSYSTESHMHCHTRTHAHTCCATQKHIGSSQQVSKNFHAFWCILVCDNTRSAILFINFACLCLQHLILNYLKKHTCQTVLWAQNQKSAPAFLQHRIFCQKLSPAMAHQKKCKNGQDVSPHCCSSIRCSRDAVLLSLSCKSFLILQISDCRNESINIPANLSDERCFAWCVRWFPLSAGH